MKKATQPRRQGIIDIPLWVMFVTIGCAIASYVDSRSGRDEQATLKKNLESRLAQVDEGLTTTDSELKVFREESVATDQLQDRLIRGHSELLDEQAKNDSRQDGKDKDLEGQLRAQAQRLDELKATLDVTQKQLDETQRRDEALATEVLILKSGNAASTGATNQSPAGGG